MKGREKKVETKKVAAFLVVLSYLLSHTYNNDLLLNQRVFYPHSLILSFYHFIILK